MMDKITSTQKQITNKFQIPIIQTQSLEFRSLYFEICLEFEFCYLGFNRFVILYIASKLRLIDDLQTHRRNNILHCHGCPRTGQ